MRKREQGCQGATTTQGTNTNRGAHNEGQEEETGSSQIVAPTKAGEGRTINTSQGREEKPQDRLERWK